MDPPHLGCYSMRDFSPWCEVSALAAPGWAQENRTQGRYSRDDGGNADEPRDDCRSRKEFLCCNGHRDDYHQDGIHDSQDELNRHGRGAADATSHALLATKPEAGLLVEAGSSATGW